MVIQSCSFSVRRALRGHNGHSCTRAHTSGQTQNVKHHDAHILYLDAFARTSQRVGTEKKTGINLKSIESSIVKLNVLIKFIEKWINDFECTPYLALIVDMGKMRALSVCECSLCQSQRKWNF